ncbi:MAG TPA: glycosyltransferase, partial [Gammaproteobacteria bacterium]|nr:glycosyltransferase [Gammaproteobacteria bacterium]
PLLQTTLLSAPPGVRISGKLSKNGVSLAMRHAQFLVLPSVCYEGFPLVIAEAFAHGLPVVCSRLGGMREIVEHGFTGLHFNPGDVHDLSVQCQWLFDHPEECLKMSKHARAEYLKHYTPETNYKLLLDIYQTTIAQYRSSVLFADQPDPVE